MANESAQKCPFLDEPFEECHVASLKSGAIERAIVFCGGEYEKCEIYRRLAMTRLQESRGAGESGKDDAPGQAARQTSQGQEERDAGMKNRSEQVSDGNAVNVQENSVKGG